MPLRSFVVIRSAVGLPKVKLAINQATTPAFHVVQADGKVRPGRQDGTGHICTYLCRRSTPVVAKPTPEGARYDFNWLSATGSGCFLAAPRFWPASGYEPHGAHEDVLAHIGPHAPRNGGHLVHAGLGFVTRYIAGLTQYLGLAFTRTGWLYPFFGTFLGWLGVALTGSDTSSNALFGSLQRITSQQLGIDPVLMCAANSAGGVMGKMVDAQSITIATAATEQVGNEGMIFRFVFWHSIALGAIVASSSCCTPTSSRSGSAWLDLRQVAPRGRWKFKFRRRASIQPTRAATRQSTRARLFVY